VYENGKEKRHFNNGKYMKIEKKRMACGVIVIILGRKYETGWRDGSCCCCMGACYRKYSFIFQEKN